MNKVRRGLVMQAATESGITAVQLIRALDEKVLPAVAAVILAHIRDREDALKVARGDLENEIG